MSTSPTVSTASKDSIAQKKVEKALTTLFELSSLCFDPFLVLNMSPELWISLKLVSALECIRKHTFSLRVVRKAALDAGLEHDKTMDAIRPVLRIERLTVTYIPKTEESEADVQKLFAEFVPVAYWKQGEKTWFAKMRSEEEAERVVLTLRARGHVVGIEAENPYIYLLSQIHNNYPLIQAKSPISQFFLLGLQTNPAGRHYSKAALQEILQGMKRLEMPVIMKSLQEIVPVISRKPRPFLCAKSLRSVRAH